jgi:hypothetical protein
LHWRVADDEVSADDVSLDTRSQKYSIRIPDNGVVFDHVAGIGGSDETDAEIVPLRHVSISTKPVPTEPVAAGAASQSYAAAGIADISIAYSNVAIYAVVGPACDENPGETVGRGGHARDRGTGAVKELNAKPTKLFNQARSTNVNAHLGVDNDSCLRSVASAVASGLGVGLPGYGEAVQLQRHFRRTNSDTGRASDGAGNVVHQLAILSDGQCTGNGPADISGMGAAGAHKERAEKCGKPCNPFQTYHLDLLPRRMSLECQLTGMAILPSRTTQLYIKPPPLMPEFLKSFLPSASATRRMAVPACCLANDNREPAHLQRLLRHVSVAPPFFSKMFACQCKSLPRWHRQRRPVHGAAIHHAAVGADRALAQGASGKMSLNAVIADLVKIPALTKRTILRSSTSEPLMFHRSLHRAHRPFVVLHLRLWDGVRDTIRRFHPKRGGVRSGSALRLTVSWATTTPVLGQRNAERGGGENLSARCRDLRHLD